MSIRKVRTSDGRKQYTIEGREHLHFIATMGEHTVQVSLQFGSQDVNGCTYFYADALFDPKAKVEFDQKMPQSAQMLVRLPNEERK